MGIKRVINLRNLGGTRLGERLEGPSEEGQINAVFDMDSVHPESSNFSDVVRHVVEKDHPFVWNVWFRRQPKRKELMNGYDAIVGSAFI